MRIYYDYPTKLEIIEYPGNAINANLNKRKQNNSHIKFLFNSCEFRLQDTRLVSYFISLLENN